MESRSINLTQKLLTCSIISLPLLFILWAILQVSSPETFQFKRSNGFASSRQQGSIDDMFLGGLLASGFNRGSCLSRYESASYRKGPSNLKPSSHLISRLRRYEDLHRRCGPYTHLYNKTIQLVTTSDRLSTTSPIECNYVVWLPFSGLGNRMLTLSSAFLYALLTNRVLLVDPASEMDNLFCEPFLQTSWLLTQNFPLLDQLSKLEENPPQYYGQLLKSGTIGYSNQSVPSFLYLNLAHDYDDHDKLFFCDQDQEVLSQVPWLILRSNNYFIPYLFLIPSFQKELESLFPEKEAVFHHLGRYLFHPTNEVWGLITRYYEAYLAKADKKIGIQIRVLESGVGGNEPYPHVMEQILVCTRKEAILPTLETSKKNTTIAMEKMKRHKAVLVTSLNSGYYEKMRDLYWENPTTNGEAMEFYQASHEEVQHSENRKHNSKAWAEIYLLSLTDELVTSSWSTFGYVAQGLGGLRPWILSRPVNRTVPEPACKRAMSIEPCFHAPPDPKFNCRRRTNEGTDEGGMISHVKQCEDRSWGLKLFD